MKTRPELLELYRRARGSIAFIDETWDLREGRRFYLLSAVVVDAKRVVVRSARLHRKHPDLWHASALWRDGKQKELARLTRDAATAHDTAHVFVAEVPEEDRRGQHTRAWLLEEAATTLAGRFDVATFVIDSRKLPDADTADWRVFRRARSVGLVHRNVTAVHTRPSREKLLQAADMLAYAYRQKHVWNNESLIELYPSETLHEHRVEVQPASARSERAVADAHRRREAAAAAIARIAAAGGIQPRVPAGAAGGRGGQFTFKRNTPPAGRLA